MTKEQKFIAITITAIIAFLFLLAAAPFSVISAGERGVVLHWGSVDRVLPEGIHWRTPIVEKVIKMDVSTQKGEVTANAASKDLQIVQAKIAINFNLRAEQVGEIYRTLQLDAANRVIAPSVQEAVKAATAKYTAEELITKRELVKGDIQLALKERLAQNFIDITNISITDFDFSAEFNKSIESKVKAEQDAQTAKNKLEQVKFEAQQTIETARAQAESIRIQAAAVTSQGGEDYVKLQAIAKWNGVLPTQMIPNATVPFIDLK